MGSTVTNGRRIAAACTAAGDVVYAMFEETYETNCRPHRPTWGCVGIGRLEDTMRRIFDLASICEGGMLRNRSGRLTPEGYAASWLKELANPFEMRSLDAVLAVGDRWCNAFSPATAEAACKTLERSGLDSQGEELRTTSRLAIAMPRDASLAALLVKSCNVSSYNILPSHATPAATDRRNAALGNRPTPCAAVTLPELEARRLDGDVRLLRRPDGSWSCGGWEFDIVGRYVKDVWREEAAEPGGYARKIRVFRRALREAPAAPANLRVAVHPTRATDRWKLERIAKIRAAAGQDSSDAPFVVICNEETQYHLTTLGDGCTDWLVEEQPSVHSPGAQSFLGL